MVLTKCLEKKLNEKTIVYDFEFLEDFRLDCAVEGADKVTDIAPTDDIPLTSVKSGPTIYSVQMMFPAPSDMEGDESDPLWLHNTDDNSPERVPHKMKGYSFCHTSILKGHFSSHPLTLMVS